MRAVVLGLGGMGRRHLAALRAVPGVELSGVADRRPEALAIDGVEPGLCRDTDPARLLEQVRPDLVVVATHAPSHHDLVLAAIEAGATRVLCEKPVATSVAEAARMRQAARRRGVRLAVNHCRRLLPAYRTLAERAASGAWGALRSATAACPGIGLGCLGTHFLDLLLFVAGDELSAVAGWIDAERGANPRGAEFHDPGGLLVARGRSGARFVLDQVEDRPGPATVALAFEGAHVAIDEGAGTIRVSERGDDRNTRPAPEQSGVVLDVVALSAAVLGELAGEGPVSCDAVHGQRALEAIVAAHVSDSRNHAEIALPLEGADATRRLAIT